MNTWIEQLTRELNDALGADEERFARKLAHAVADHVFGADEDEDDSGPPTKDDVVMAVLICLDVIGLLQLDDRDVSEALERATSIVGRHDAAA